MKRELSTCLWLLSICMIVLSCNHNNKNTPERFISRKQPSYKKKNFDSLVNVVEKRMATGLDYYGELLNDKAFVEIYGHSENYFIDAFALLTQKQFTTSQAVICIFSMQSLTVSEYVNFCGICVTVYNNGKLTGQLLEQVLAPDFLKRNILAENYKNPDVIKLLNKLHNNRNLPKELKEFTEEILAGKYSSI